MIHRGSPQQNRASVITFTEDDARRVRKLIIRTGSIEKARVRLGIGESTMDCARGCGRTQAATRERLLIALEREEAVPNVVVEPDPTPTKGETRARAGLRVATNWGGTQFGWSVVLERVGTTYAGHKTMPLWSVRCGCGVVFEKSSAQLLQSKRKANLVFCDTCMAAHRARTSQGRRMGEALEDMTRRPT